MQRSDWLGDASGALEALQWGGPGGRGAEEGSTATRLSPPRSADIPGSPSGQHRRLAATHSPELWLEDRKGPLGSFLEPQE